MNKARRNPLNTAAMHGTLIIYVLIALFPVFVIRTIRQSSTLGQGILLVVTYMSSVLNANEYQ